MRFPWLTSPLALLALAPVEAVLAHAAADPVPALAQKGGVHKDARYGFKFRPPRGWRSIALQTNEVWLTAKYQSDNVFHYTDKKLGETWDHTPELMCIAFVHERAKPAKVEEKQDEDGNRTKTVTIKNPYEDYEDFLDRTYSGV